MRDTSKTPRSVLLNLALGLPKGVDDGVLLDVLDLLESKLAMHDAVIRKNC